MLEEKNIQVRIECQQFKGEDFFCDIEEKRSVAVTEDSATLRSDMSAVYGVGVESDATDIEDIEPHAAHALP